MTETEQLLRHAARAHLLSRGDFNRAWVAYWNAIEPLDDETGFRLLEVFRRQVQTYRFDLKRKDVGVRQAAGEIFRLVAVEEADYSFEDARRFARWYRRLAGHISGSIGHLFDYHGDGFGDLCDSLPLAGRAVAERCLATHPKSGRPRREGFLDENEVAAAVGEACGADWQKFIVNGENYVASALEDAARKWYLHELVRGGEWDDAEERLLEYSDVGDDD